MDASKVKEIEKYVTTKDICNWLDVTRMTVMRWPWWREHMTNIKGYSAIVPLRVVEEFVGGPLEPMYTLHEVCEYLNVSKYTVWRMKPRRVEFGPRTHRYPESSLIEMKARRSARRFTPLT